MSRGFVKIVFAGTPEFANPTLSTLVAAGYSLLGVLTQPDRPAGRGRRITASAVKRQAQALGIPVSTPATGAGAEDVVRALRPDVVVVVAYGLLLPKGLLDLPRHGCLNVHASLLPRWRGAAPIARAIEAGDEETGVTIIRLDEGLDTGPMLRREPTAIGPTETAPKLADRLAVLGAQALAAVLARIAEGEPLNPIPQPEAGATYARKLRKEEAIMDWGRDAISLERQVRAFTPWPGTTTGVHGVTVKVCAARSVADDRCDPGRVLATDGELRIGTGRGALILETLQAPNGRPQAAASFLHKYPLKIGDRLD